MGAVSVPARLRYVWFDSLNRYYLAEEASELAACFEAAPGSFEHVLQFRNDQARARRPGAPRSSAGDALARAAMTRLPLLDPASSSTS